MTVSALAALGRRAIVLFSALAISLAGAFVVAPVASANYTNQCDTGSVGFYETYSGIGHGGSITGAIYGSYSDVYYGQDTTACAFPFPNHGGTWVEGANVAGTGGDNQLVQLAIGQEAGESTTFWYTPSDHASGTPAHVSASNYPWAPVQFDVYRQFIWEDNGYWDFCIDDITAGHEGCITNVARTWTTVLSEYQAYETWNTNDQMGAKCCVGAPLNISNMHYQPVYQGNRSWVGPVEGPLGNTWLPSYFKDEWQNSTTWEAYTQDH